MLTELRDELRRELDRASDELRRATVRLGTQAFIMAARAAVDRAGRALVELGGALDAIEDEQADAQEAAQRVAGKGGDRG